jgi:hypothetical protein
MPSPVRPRESTVVTTFKLSGRPAPSAAPGAPPPEYVVRRTTQVDEYESAPPPSAVIVPAAPRPTGDAFKGTARRVAKISLAAGAAQEFDDLKDLIASLPSDDDMIALDIPDTKSSNRVAQERKNVKVRAFIYAASRENDNDFHVIIGRDPDQSRLFMNVEVSGLPQANHANRAKLKKARDTFKAFFADHPEKLPGTSYDFYEPPIPVLIGGSLFFDVTHATGGKPGPQDLRDDIPTIWEIHPVSTLEFEPE